MCSTSACDLEEIPLDDDDPNSVEFRILAYYVRHHVFKSTPAVFSPKLPRTRSLSQKGLGSWSANESWTQVSWPCRNSRSSEKPINLAKKKSSWKALLGLVEKEEESQSLPAGIQRQGLRTAEFQGGRPSQQWSRSLPSVDQCLDREAADPRVVSIANRVAEIVYSWPPLDAQGGGVKSRGNLEFQAVCLGREGPQPLASSSKKDEEDQVIAKIVELLKYSGDQLERELKKDKALMSSFPDGLPYSVFKTITDQCLRGVDTRGESEVKAQGFKAALAIDVMAKLTAVDNHPMNRVLGFGAKYLRENFSPWVQQQGGWEKILGLSHEEID
ncbi:apoptosis facilitator Bcl-2-like protein 14 isoform X2 [Microcebus murinus]|uniref:BCL2 like 14 n=2 Tax=Microcebus murinus TaxID=30608 RepID=A0A8B7FLV0_MICMU|nr:apoptosis facilitator Bcl-2-like protein 14 isoform X2 [Microcebus murinus]XP_012609157.1 apoptosis facilitator Bcl-2-like protein 14 isoform X2 [Microcebus murinus]